MRRRHFLLAPLAAPSLARADTWPSQNITFMVPNGAGGTTDIAARLAAAGMMPLLSGRAVMVDNRPGADGAIAIRATLRARDTHTFLCAYSGYVVGTPHLTPDLGYDVLADLLPIGQVLDAPHAVLIHSSIPATTLAELAAHIRANPGKLNYGSTGTGSVQHLGTELFRQQAGGLDLVHVPYRAVGPAIQDLLAGRIEIFVTTIPPIAGLVRDGRLRALAVTAPTRSDALPGVPSAVEAGMPGLDVVTWVALYAPAGTAAPVIGQMSAALRGVLDDPVTVRRMADQGATPGIGGPAELAERTRREYAMWGQVIRDGNIRAD
ncbi:MAG: transporter substrate-binding protein [Rubritepida sp.]|nr:transporter substrate-binding protein [Rubritepida sp.]